MSSRPRIVRRLLRLGALRARGEAGDTLVEIMFAAFLAAIIVGAMAATFASGNGSSYAAQRESALVAAASQQMENIRQLVKLSGFSALALSSLPAAGTTATVKFNSVTSLDPNSFQTTCGSSAAYQIENNYNDTSAGLVTSIPSEPGCAAGVEPLIIGGLVSPAPASVTVGGMIVNLYEYVTTTSVGCNTSLGSGSCTNDARRVIVAAVDHQAQSSCSSTVSTTNLCRSSADAPVYLSTIFTNPTPSNAPNSSIGITLGVQLG